MTDDKDKRIAELEKENEKLKAENKELDKRLDFYIEGPKNPFADPEFARTHTYGGGGSFPRRDKKKE